MKSKLDEIKRIINVLEGEEQEDVKKDKFKSGDFEKADNGVKQAITRVRHASKAIIAAAKELAVLAQEKKVKK